METLPAELIHLITSYITDGEDRISLACVSRNFQLAIERYSFRAVRIKNFELLAFTQHFRYAHRRTALRKLEYSIRLPEYTVRSTQWAESKQTKRINNEVFTKAILGLFRVLSTWNHARSSGAGPHGLTRTDNYGVGIHLHIIEVYTNSDPGYQDHKFVEELDDLELENIQWRRYKHSYLKLVPVPCFTGHSEPLESQLEQIESADRRAAFDPQETDIEGVVVAIPVIERVTNFTVNTTLNPGRKIEPMTPLILAGKMPNLKNLSLSRMHDDENRFPERRLRMRQDCGQSLLKLCSPGNASLANLQSFELYLSPQRTSRVGCNVPVLHPSHPTTDFLSIGLHALSSLPNLKKVHLGLHCQRHDLLSMCISPALFWSGTSESTVGVPYWPSLEHFEIAIHPLAPSGKWYISRDPSAPPPHGRLRRRRLRDITPSGSERSFSDQSATPPEEAPHGSVRPPYAARLRAMVVGPIRGPFRGCTRLDPDTFIPLLLAGTKMITIARHQKLAKFALILDLGDYNVYSGLRDPPTLYSHYIDFELYFFHSGVSGLEGLERTMEQQQLRNRHRVIIRVAKHLRWDIIQNIEEVGKALRDAVGEDGSIRVDTVLSDLSGEEILIE